MRKIIVITIIVGLLLSSLTISIGGKEVVREEQSCLDDIDRWAIIIGITDYKGSYYDLGAPAKEAKALSNELKNADSNWNQNNIQLLIDEAATRQNILNALDWLKDNADTGDIILFSFNGHGSYIDDVNGDEFDKRDETIVSWELADIIDDELESKFDEIDNKNIKGMFLIFDCCFSGGLIDKVDLFRNEGLQFDEVEYKVIERLRAANNYTAELMEDIGLGNRVVLVSTIPRGIGFEFRGDNGWYSFTRGVWKAIERYRKSAEGISRYAKLWWYSRPELFLLFLDSYFWSLAIELLIEEGIILLPLPRCKDRYPANTPFTARLFVISK